MAPAKTAKATKKTAAKKRRLSPQHKAALAEGRTMSATVDRYITYINMPKTRGRKVPLAELRRRREAARETVRTATGVAKLTAAQDARDLEARIATLEAASNGTNGAKLEADFIKVAKRFGAARSVGYGAYREAGVSAVVLKKAGVARTRGDVN